METILICGWIMFVQPKQFITPLGETKDYWFYVKTKDTSTITLWIDKPNVCPDNFIKESEFNKEEESED